MLMKDLVKEVVTVPYSLNIAGVAVTMNLNKHHCVLVEHHDGSFGIITEKDIVREVVARCQDPSVIRAWEIMKQPVIMVDHETSIADAIGIMKGHRIRNLVVTQQGKVIGVVKRSIILNSLKFEESPRQSWVKNRVYVSHESV
jgi:signal-transduction protein with cAMP-binding, CBS, and nucleotidyltransferase domain